MRSLAPFVSWASSSTLRGVFSLSLDTHCSHMSEPILPISHLEIIFLIFLFFSHSTHFSLMSEPILPISHL